MIGKQILESLGRTEGIEGSEDGPYRFSKDHEGTFYFGQQGAIAVSRVREIRLHGDLIELRTSEERAFFACEELVGFKVRLPKSPTERGVSAGFSSR